MKTKFFILCLLSLVVCHLVTAQTAKSRTGLYAEIESLFADTGSAEITPADVRAALKDITASSYNGLTDGAGISASTVNGYFASPTTNGSFSASAWRSALSLVPGTDVQAYSANLATFASISPSANIQSLLGAANYAAVRSQLSLVAGTDFLAYPTGTPSGSKFLRDDNSWQLITGGGDALTTNPLTQFNGITATNTEFNYVHGVTAAIQGQLDVKQPLDPDLTYLAGFTPSTNVKAILNAADYSAVRTLLNLIPGTDVQAYDADLAIYAGITPSANVQSLLGAASYSGMRTLLSLVPGTDVQAYNANLTTFAGIAPSANIQTFLGAANYAAARTSLGVVPGTDVQAFDADLSIYAGITPSANVQGFLGAANYAAMRTQLSLVPGTDVQVYDAELAALAGLTSAADKLPYFTGSGTAAVTDFTSTARSLLDDSSTTAMRATLGLVIGTDVQAYDADLAYLAGFTPSANVKSILNAADYAAVKTLLSLTNVENTALSTWAGTANITTLGTITTGTWNAGTFSYTKTGATAQTYYTGLTLTNSTAASAGAQQFSPSLVFTGQGWKTDVTAASQQADWRISNAPAEGTANPTPNLVFASQVNGGGFTNYVTFGGPSGHDLVMAQGDIYTAINASFRFTGRSRIFSPADGVIRLSNDAQTGFTRLNFGGTTSSFVALQSSGTTMTIGTADGGTSSGSLTVSSALTVAGTTKLSALSNGLLKATSGDGTLAIATAGTDYVSPATNPIAVFVFNGQGSTVVASTTTGRPLSVASTIHGYYIRSDVSGSITIDIKRAVGSGSFSSITASATPALSSASYVASTTLTGWTTSLSAGDSLQATCSSITGIGWATLVLY